MIFWQSPNLLADLPPNFCWQISLTVIKSGSIWSPNLLADLSPTICASRYSDSHQICWQIPFWHYLLTGRFSDSYQTCWQIYPPTNSISRFSDRPQICWQIYPSTILLADFSDSYQICQHLVTRSSSRFTPLNFCWHIFWQSLNLPADLSPKTSAIRFSDSHQILLVDLPSKIFCWQIFWQSLNLPADLPPNIC